MHEHTRIDIAERLDAALDTEADAAWFDATDPLRQFVSLGAEIRELLHQPSLTAAERARIRARVLDLASAQGHGGLRRAWPQLAQLRAHPAVVGGAAAAMLAVAGLVALHERRGHSGSVLNAA
jgi:hypothetical protein